MTRQDVLTTIVLTVALFAIGAVMAGIYGGSSLREGLLVAAGGLTGRLTLLWRKRHKPEPG